MLGGGGISCLAEEGHYTSLDVVAALGSGGQVVMACFEVVPISKSKHGGQRRPQELTEPALPLANREGH